MAGYEINFSKMKTAAEKFETTLKDIQKEIKNLETIQKTDLSDTVWKGPNKDRYVASMTKYQSALQELYKNANDHYVKITDIMNKYSANEANQ